MGEFLRYSSIPRPKSVAELTPQAQQFKQFKPRTTNQEAARIVDLAFCPTKPHRLAIVTGTKVGLWKQANTGDWEKDAAITKFKDVTQCVSWRSDGRLLLAGEAGGSCAVIEADSHKVLRRLRGHGDAVTCACFAAADKTKAATGGRDGKLRVWDVATSELLDTIDAHDDTTKVLLPGPAGPDSWITAGYDGRIKLWDARTCEGRGEVTGACVCNMDHGHPVEAGVRFPDGNLIATAAGTVVRFWDLVAGGKMVQELSNAHAKAVMSLSLNSSAGVMLTASFDGLAKLYNAVNLEHIFTYKLPAPATCAAWRPDNGALAVGMDDGRWQVRQPQTSKQSAAEAAPPPKRTYKERFGRLRGKDAVPAEEDDIIKSERPAKRKEAKIDYFLRKFEYRKVVEYMTDATVDDFLSVVEELMQRGALRKALHEVGEDTCVAFLTKLVKCGTVACTSNMHQSLYFEALHTLLDSNRCLQPPSNPKLLDCISKIEQQVANELKTQESLTELNGILKTVMMT